jgi:hypothetical protein
MLRLRNSPFSGIPFNSAFTSRNSRFAFVFLAIVFASFRVILQNRAVLTPKTTPSQGSLPAESSRVLPKTTIWTRFLVKTLRKSANGPYVVAAVFKARQ